MPDAKIVPLGPVSQWDDSSQRALRRMKTWKGQANALCHRDYTTGTSVQINVYMDFIEIVSPGLFPEGDPPTGTSRDRAAIPSSATRTSRRCSSDRA